LYAHRSGGALLPWPIADGRDRSGDHASYGSGLRRLPVPTQVITAGPLVFAIRAVLLGC